MAYNKIIVTIVNDNFYIDESSPKSNKEIVEEIKRNINGWELASSDVRIELTDSKDSFHRGMNLID